MVSGFVGHFNNDNEELRHWVQPWLTYFFDQGRRKIHSGDYWSLLQIRVITLDKRFYSIEFAEWRENYVPNLSEFQSGRFDGLQSMRVVDDSIEGSPEYTNVSGCLNWNVSKMEQEDLL